MELRYLRAFVVVAEELNFRRAAERLQMAQPPLSQQIKRLERELGVTLFRRTTRQVTLTPAGEACLAEARTALAATAALPRVGRQAEEGLLGTVRLGFTGPASYEVLTVVAGTFRKHCPGVRLAIQPPGFGGELIESVRAKAIDIALVRLPLNTSRLAVREIATGATGAVLPDAHPLAAADHVELRQLGGEPVIDYPSRRGVAFSGSIRTAFLEHGIVPDVVQEAPDTVTLMLLVGAGVGIGFVPMSMRYFRAPGITLRSVEGLPPTTLAMVWREDDENPALHSLVGVLDEVLETCSTLV